MAASSRGTAILVSSKLGGKSPNLLDTRQHAKGGFNVGEGGVRNLKLHLADVTLDRVLIGRNFWATGDLLETFLWSLLRFPNFAGGERSRVPPNNFTLDVYRHLQANRPTSDFFTEYRTLTVIHNLISIQRPRSRPTRSSSVVTLARPPLSSSL